MVDSGKHDVAGLSLFAWPMLLKAKPAAASHILPCFRTPHCCHSADPGRAACTVVHMGPALSKNIASVSLDFLVLAVILCVHTGLQHSKEASNVLPEMHCCTGLHFSRLLDKLFHSSTRIIKFPDAWSSTACNCESFDNPIAYLHADTFDWLRQIHMYPARLSHVPGSS